MDVGKLDKRITIEQKVKERDAAGEPKDVWQKVKTVWANVRFERGMESIRNNKDSATSKVSIRIRYRTDLDESMRVIFSKRAYSIISVLPDEQDRKWLDLVVEATK